VPAPIQPQLRAIDAYNAREPLIEWLRSFGDLGFTWAVAGDTLASYPLLIQTAELGGVWLLTLWVTALSVTLYRLARPLPSTRRARQRWPCRCGTCWRKSACRAG